MGRGKGLGIVFMVLLVVIGVWAAVAQDEAPAGCTADSLTALVSQIQEANGQAIESIAAGDLTAAIDVLSASDERVGLMKAVCAGLSFEGTEGSVIGPVDIPEGVYRAIATTPGFIIVHVEPLDGECGEGTRMRSGGLFNEAEGQATQGAEKIFASANCTVLIEVDNVQAPWTLMFEKVD